jgi:hypothetical protein
MTYEETWKILAEFLTELKERGIKTPSEVMNDLRSAKTIIQVLKADPKHNESILRINEYLRNVESYAISTAEKIEKRIAENWLKKLKNHKKGKPEKKIDKTSRFLPGVPKNKNWVRIKMTEDIPLENLKKSIKANGLSYKAQKNGYFIIYGQQENVKNFIKMIKAQFYITKK